MSNQNCLSFFSTNTVISIVGIVFCLVAVSSKLFLSQPMVFIFCASNSPLQRRMEAQNCGWEVGEEEGVINKHMVWRVLVGALNWGMPFLDHDILTQEFPFLCSQDQ